MNTIAGTDLSVFPVCLGGNVFGWTVKQDDAFTVLDAFVAAGGNFFDTSDLYWKFKPGNVGGESETIIGEWLRRRKNRDSMVVSTKIGALDGMAGGLTSSNIRRYAEGSLKRLSVDNIDLLYTHIDDTETPLEETLSGFDALIRDGKVRYIASSNYDAERLREAIAIAEREGLPRYVATQSLYSLVERDFEATHRDVVTELGLSVLPYYSLGAGFLTGKYRPDAEKGASVRTAAEKRPANPLLYLDEPGLKLLEILDEVAENHQTALPAVSLAWLLAQKNVLAPIASARNISQLDGFLPAATLTLTDDEVKRLGSTHAA